MGKTGKQILILSVPPSIFVQYLELPYFNSYMTNISMNQHSIGCNLSFFLNGFLRRKIYFCIKRNKYEKYTIYHYISSGVMCM